MAAPGDVLFQIGQNDGTDSDIWDDTALITAYDKAINSVKAEISGKINGEQSMEAQDGTNSESASRKASKKGKQKRRKRKSSNKQKWKIGDRCSAVFTEDNLVYDGIIKSVNYKLGTCWITYTGYGNEEEKDLDELMPPGQSEVMSQDEDYSENGYDSYEANGFGPPLYPGSRDYPPPHPSHSRYYAPSPPPWQFGHPWSSLTPQSPFEHLPPAPGSYHMRGPRNIPHPPPLSMAEGETDQEALYAMLMSWYMSGYHTGYFQGVKSARRRHTSKPTADR